MADRRLRYVAAAAIALASSGCVRGCTSSQPPIHLNPSMDQQPKYKPQAASAFFYDGSAMRKPVAGTIARGELHEDPAFFEGLGPDGQPLTAMPASVTEEMKARGAERYKIYCAPCHDARGDGKGILFQRGKVPTPTFHDDKMRSATDGHIYGVITNGSGLMPSYRWPIAPADRWAIVAYVRELQQKRLADSPDAAVAAATPPAAAAPAGAASEAGAAPADAAAATGGAPAASGTPDAAAPTAPPSAAPSPGATP